MRRYAGMWAVLEGGEAIGKSTQARLLAAHYRALGHEVVLTREPGGSPLAEKIRGLVLAEHEEGMPPIAEALLMYAARAAHIAALIRPALERGALVICDRFEMSSRAYQGLARGLPVGVFDQLGGMVVGDLSPDVTLVLDISTEERKRRLAGRADNNRFDAESDAFMGRVATFFREAAAQGGNRIHLVDGEAPQEVVTERLVGHIDRMLVDQRCSPGVG